MEKKQTNKKHQQQEKNDKNKIETKPSDNKAFRQLSELQATKL